MIEKPGPNIIRTREIEFLLSCLVEAHTRQSRQIVLERLIPILPRGYHPSVFIENHPEALIRLQLRLHHELYLNEIKLRVDIKRHIHSSTNPDLEMGAFLISRLSGEQSWTPESFGKSLDNFIQPFLDRIELQWAQNDLLENFLNFVYQEQHLSPNKDHYYNPENSYITRVLSSRQGIPVTLGVLTILLARRCGLVLEGINMPGHFLLMFEDSIDENLNKYIDPYNSGFVLTQKDCLAFLEKQSIKPSLEYLKPVGTISIMKRMYRNLISFYASTGDKGKEKILRQHFAILENGSIGSA